MAFANGLDGPVARPYLPLAMIRFLLTLLALLTGLGAQVSPAQASMRSGGETEIGAIGELAGAAGLAARVAAHAQPTARTSALADEAMTGPMPRLPVAVPAVRIGIDRARE